MNIPLLADKNLEISSMYFLFFEIDSTTDLCLAKYGVLKDDEGIAFRGLFIIDPNGILRQITINDLPVGRSVDETLRLVQAFQFTDKYGEGNCSRFPMKPFIDSFVICLQFVQLIGNQAKKQLIQMYRNRKNTLNMRIRKNPLTVFFFLLFFSSSSLIPVHFSILN